MIVLDTHVLIWVVRNDERLGRKARTLIEVADTSGLIVPAFCAWELAQIERRQNLTFEGGVLKWFNRILADPAFRLSPPLPEIAISSVTLEWSHKDPADRAMVATAQHHGLPLMTAAGPILAFAAAGQVVAIDARR